jgi:hypothetical protein
MEIRFSEAVAQASSGHDVSPNKTSTMQLTLS